MKTRNLLLGTVFSAGVFAASACAVSENLIKITEYSLDTGKLNESVRIAVLSDLHFSKFGKDNIRLVNAVKKASPDILLLAGDFFDMHGGKTNTELVKSTLKGLCEVCPVYFTPGNHDKRYDVLTGESCMDYVREAGCTVFDGEYQDIEIKGQKLRIGGIFDYNCLLEDYGRAWSKSPVYAFLKEFENTDLVKIVMMHRPNTFMYTYGYTDDDWNIDAVISGHDHGGVWRLPVIGGIYAAEQGLFPKYDCGIYEFGRMKMFLSTGLEGFYKIPRMFNRAECMCITVK